jgi:hypothetical protein
MTPRGGALILKYILQDMQVINVLWLCRAGGSKNNIGEAIPCGPGVGEGYASSHMKHKAPLIIIY